MKKPVSPPGWTPAATFDQQVDVDESALVMDLINDKWEVVVGDCRIAVDSMKNFPGFHRHIRRIPKVEYEEFFSVRPILSGDNVESFSVWNNIQRESAEEFLVGKYGYLVAHALAVRAAETLNEKWPTATGSAKQPKVPNDFIHIRDAKSIDRSEVVIYWTMYTNGVHEKWRVGVNTMDTVCDAYMKTSSPHCYITRVPNVEYETEPKKREAWKWEVDKLNRYSISIRCRGVWMARIPKGNFTEAQLDGIIAKLNEMEGRDG